MRVPYILTLIAAVLLVSAGCAKKEAAAPPQMNGNFAEAKLMASVAPQRHQDNTLAYEHNVEVELAADLLAARIEAVRAACGADKDGGCTLLEISNRVVNEVPEGNVRLRLAPGGVDAFVKLASEGGRVVDSRTYAEDLAQPLADTERQLSLLNLHRQRLMEFMVRKDIGVEQLITVSRELATVQAQIEEFGSQRTNLRRRVDTELLTINWRAPVGVYESAQSPVRDALRSFGANFREAIAQVITFLAFVLPWLVIAVPGLMLVRWLWRRVSEWFHRRRTA